MQTHQIKNHMMSLTVAEHGAEITSIQLEGIERMWDADPAFWGRTAPVLFPIVGALKDNSYRYEGQTYLMGQHGFARDMDFTLTDQTEDKLEFTLSYAFLSFELHYPTTSTPPYSRYIPAYFLV